MSLLMSNLMSPRAQVRKKNASEIIYNLNITFKVTQKYSTADVIIHL